MVSQQQNGDHVAYPKARGNKAASPISAIPGPPPPSYPTQSLNFLRNVKDWVSPPPSRVQAKLPLNIIIVGAGLGGLATAISLALWGHSVSVYEQAPKLAEVGAGIQVPPNTVLLLRRWGVLPHLSRHLVRPSAMTFRRWEDGTPIGLTKLMPDFENDFGNGYFVVHRAHLHDALYTRAKELGVRVEVNAKVEEYDAERARIRLADGREVAGDLVVAADGVKSIARETICPGSRPKGTGYAVYRATVDVTKMKQDPEVSGILDNPGINIWIGHDRHVMTYPISSGQSFNMVLSHRDETDPTTWNGDSVLASMRKEFEGWDPQLTKIISLIENAIKWPLMTVPPVRKWVSSSSSLVILGDAAHAMLPYMSQGAAMAIEDGAALAVVLSHITAETQLPFALGAFEAARRKRSYQMQEASNVNAYIWHLADGPEQIARDEGMRAEVEGRRQAWSANQWSDPVTMWWTYGYDAEGEMQRSWERELMKLIP